MCIRFQRFNCPSRCLSVLAVTALGNVTACVPYTVGSSAKTAAPGTSTFAASTYVIPATGDSLHLPLPVTDLEWRHGIDDHSDFGFRMMAGAGGLVGDYKRRILDAGPGQPALAYVVGGGVENWGNHGILEATLIASGDESSPLVPYGGVRALQLIPLAAYVSQQPPSVGGFLGFKMDDAGMSIRPELGVYYNQAAPGLRRNNVILVPAVTLAADPVHPHDITEGLEAARVATAVVEATTRPQPRRRRRCSLLCRLLGIHP